MCFLCKTDGYDFEIFYRPTDFCYCHRHIDGAGGCGDVEYVACGAVS